MTLLKYSLAAFFGMGTLTVGWAVAIRKTLTRSAWFFLAGGVAIAAVAVDALIIEPNWIQVRKVVIHDAELAPALKDLKIVQITDIHMTKGLSSRERQLIRKVNALKPDLIFFTGDIIDDLAQVGPANELLRSLKASIGVYGVPGNTDHIVMNSQAFVQAFASSHMDTLVNEGRRVLLPNGYILWLLGIDDPKYHYGNLKQTLRGIPEGTPTLLLAHCPDIFEDAAREKINLVLAGDTHGGQVAIDFLIRMSDYANRTPYMRGLFERGKTKMYVNRGIGTKTLPIRFLCRPEISVIQVKP